MLFARIKTTFPRSSHTKVTWGSFGTQAAAESWFQFQQTRQPAGSHTLAVFGVEEMEGKSLSKLQDMPVGVYVKLQDAIRELQEARRLATIAENFPQALAAA